MSQKKKTGLKRNNTAQKRSTETKEFAGGRSLPRMEKNLTSTEEIAKKNGEAS